MKTKIKMTKNTNSERRVHPKQGCLLKNAKATLEIFNRKL